MSHEFVINSNGDHPDTLKDEFIAVMDAARALTDALQVVTVDGRNYQSLPDGGRSERSRACKERLILVQGVGAVYTWAKAGAIRVIDQE